MGSLSALSWAHLFELYLYSEREHKGRATAPEVSHEHLKTQSVPLRKVTILLWGLTPSAFLPENTFMTIDYEEAHHFPLCSS